jgi:hypothetical protein
MRRGFAFLARAHRMPPDDGTKCTPDSWKLELLLATLAVTAAYVAKRLPLRTGLEWVARVGYAARGTLFVALGLLAAAVAIGARSRAADSKDVLRVLLGEPSARFCSDLLP